MASSLAGSQRGEDIGAQAQQTEASPPRLGNSRRLVWGNRDALGTAYNMIPSRQREKKKKTKESVNHSES